MASVLDVVNTTCAQVSGFMYPGGLGQASITGKAVNVIPGWPMPAQLDVDMPQGIADVSVYPTPTEKNVTRYKPEQKVMSIAAATVTLTAGVGTLTVGGAMPSPFTPHNVAALIAGQAFIYPVQPADTLTSIATGLAALIAQKYPGTANSGPVISIAGGVHAAAARVGTTGTVTTEWERQAQVFQITTWAPDPVVRDKISEAIKVALAQITFLLMPDGYGARIRYVRSLMQDEPERAHIYRRDLFYEIEFATTATQQIATVVATEVQIQDAHGNPIAARTY